jgi:hypothetical protein
LRRYGKAFGRQETGLREVPQGRARQNETAAATERHGETWTPEEDRALLAKHAAGMHPCEIAAHPDHRRRTCRSKCV